MPEYIYSGALSSSHDVTNRFDNDHQKFTRKLEYGVVHIKLSPEFYA